MKLRFPIYKEGDIIKLTDGRLVEVFRADKNVIRCNHCIFSVKSKETIYTECRSARYHLLPGHRDMNCANETIPRRCAFKLLDEGV